MRVLRDAEVATKGVHPVLGFAEKIFIFLVFFRILVAVAGGNNFFFFRRALIKNGRIIAAVKINVGHGEEMVGE